MATKSKKEKPAVRETCDDVLDTLVKTHKKLMQMFSPGHDRSLRFVDRRHCRWARRGDHLWLDGTGLLWACSFVKNDWQCDGLTAISAGQSTAHGLYIVRDSLKMSDAEFDDILRDLHKREAGEEDDE